MQRTALTLGDLQCSVFEVPRTYVKGRKTVGYLVCNSMAQDIDQYNCA